MQSSSEQKSPQKSNAKPVLIVLALVLAASAVGFFAYRSHQQKVSDANWVISCLYGETGSSLDSPFAENHEFFDRRFEQVRDSGVFQEALLADLQARIDYSLENYYDAGIHDSWREAVEALSQRGYDDPAIREALRDYLTQRVRKMKEDSKSEQNLAKALDNGYTSVKEWNEAVSQGYQIDPAEFCSVDEIRTHYSQALWELQQAGDIAEFVKVYENASTSEALAGQPLMEPEALLDVLLPDRGSAEMITLVNGVGGYYDSSEHRAEVQETLSRFNEYGFHGDFYSNTYIVGANKYDMTEFNANPGLWAAIGEDMQRFITESNRGTKHTNFFFRGKAGKGTIDQLIDLGFEYGYTYGADDDQVNLYISRDAMCYQGYMLVGDYTALFEQLKADFAAREGAPVRASLNALYPLSEYGIKLGEQKDVIEALVGRNLEYMDDPTYVIPVSNSGIEDAVYLELVGSERAVDAATIPNPNSEYPCTLLFDDEGTLIAVGVQLPWSEYMAARQTLGEAHITGSTSESWFGTLNGETCTLTAALPTQGGEYNILCFWR